MRHRAGLLPAGPLGSLLYIGQAGGRSFRAGLYDGFGVRGQRAVALEAAAADHLECGRFAGSDLAFAGCSVLPWC
jgi:hypothetical protein